MFACLLDLISLMMSFRAVSSGSLNSIFVHSSTYSLIQIFTEHLLYVRHYAQASG